ncbi:cytochrome P450 [Solirubrobacter soli]|uniref:cytochrome P450 n=1 Tax=Solirubrobacter soli TaxID=363832 RepID=UPI00040590FB|nr:cytochrome P450 [Solirubrobacter soli]
MDEALTEASLAEQLAFNAVVLVPNALQGLFTPRRTVTAVAKRADVNRLAIGLIGRLRDAAAARPVRLRALRDPAVLVFAADDVRTVLEGSPEPFAPDPPAKRRGMEHFQPDALTISRGEAWADRRRFTETVLGAGSAERFAAVADEEVRALLDASGGELGWDEWHAGHRRVARRVILGDAARHDDYVSQLLARLMGEANGLPASAPPSEPLLELMARLRTYAEAAEPGSLVSFFAQAPSGAGTDTVGQLPHWLFAMSDTLAMNSLRALALLASHTRIAAKARREVARGGELRFVEACLDDTMRLWPTTPILGRVTLTDVDLGGGRVPAGTQVLISNTFNHRDPERAMADRFSPEAWTDGDAREDWMFNHFSHGRQGCPGAGLARLLGGRMLAGALGRPDLRLLAPRLVASRPLPVTFDVFDVRVGVG